MDARLVHIFFLSWYIVWAQDTNFLSCRNYSWKDTPKCIEATFVYDRNHLGDIKTKWTLQKTRLMCQNKAMKHNLPFWTKWTSTFTLKFLVISNFMGDISPWQCPVPMGNDPQQNVFALKFLIWTQNINDNSIKINTKIIK